MKTLKDLVVNAVAIRALIQKIKENKVYAFQFFGAVVFVLVNYLAGPFISNEAVLGIGAALVVPEPLWKALISVLQRLVEAVKERR